jgi:hypothetical protein
MDPTEIAREEAEDARMAVEALNAATQRAIESGLPIVVVVDDKLVRIDASGQTVLKHLPPLQKVAVRQKRAST